jgi:hypothetical protein
VLLQLFAQILPDLCAADAPTRLYLAIEAFIHSERLDPVYRRRIALAETVGRIAARGEAETRLATGVLREVELYVRELTGERPSDGVGAGDDVLG